MTRSLFRLARLAADLRALSRGPGPTARRVRNKAVGRALARSGAWSRLWGSRR